MRYPAVTGRSAPTSPKTKGIVAEVVRACDAVPQLHDPIYRRLRVYAVDPSFSTRLDTAGIDETTLQVRWESLKPEGEPSVGKPPSPAGTAGPARRAPGPMGEYFEIDDADAADEFYGMVDLDDPRLLALEGWAPSEGDPHFHQQMVYAVAMNTVQQFEGRSAGRSFGGRCPTAPSDDRLTLRPHALRQANAFYSPEEVALLLATSTPTLTTRAKMSPVAASIRVYRTTSSPTKPLMRSLTECSAITTSRPTLTCLPSMRLLLI